MSILMQETRLGTAVRRPCDGMTLHDVSEVLNDYADSTDRRRGLDRDYQSEDDRQIEADLRHLAGFVEGEAERLQCLETVSDGEGSLAIQNTPKLVPPEIKEGLLNYARRNIPVGGFLRAVIEGNLMAVFRADNDNIRVLRSIVGFAENNLPLQSRNSKEAYEAWIKKGVSDAGDEQDKAF